MDKRKIANQRVKDRLFCAIIELAGQKDCSNVTVTELIEKSGVARASFYRNFRSVEEIIDYGIGEMARRYHDGMPSDSDDPHSLEAMLYKFRFYREHADLVLAFHRAKVTTTLLDIITDCEIEACGDMPSSSISRYELYFYAGAFYNMMLSWLEDGMKETPEDMAEEFLRIAGRYAVSSPLPL